MTVTFTLISMYDRAWAKAGHELGFEQLVIYDGPAPSKSDAVVYPYAVEALQTDREITVAVGETVYTFDRARGLIAGITHNGREQLTEPARLTVWRAPDRQRPQYPLGVAALGLRQADRKVLLDGAYGKRVRPRGYKIVGLAGRLHDPPGDPRGR